MHEADIGIRLDRAGLFAAMELAGTRGDFDGFKRALQQAYGSGNERVYHRLIDTHYEYILKQTWNLMDATSEADEASLVFWATLAEDHERRNQ